MQESLEGSAPDDLDPLVRNSPILRAGRKRELALIEALEQGEALSSFDYTSAMEFHACRIATKVSRACWVLTAANQTCDSSTCPVRAMRRKAMEEQQRKSHEFVTDWYMLPSPDKQTSTEG